MAKKQNITWEDVRKDLTKYMQNVLSGTAAKIRDDLTEEAFNSIKFFYASYTPSYYKRHYYNFLNKSFKKYYANPHNVIYRGGVQLTPEEMDDIYQDPTYEVFDSVYAGFHGVSSMFYAPYSFSVTPVMEPSPMQRILDRRDYIVSHIDDYVLAGINKANKGTYSVIKWGKQNGKKC